MSSATQGQQAATCKNEGDALYRDKKYQVAVMKYTQAINLLHPQGLTPSSDESTFQTLYVSYSNRCACFLQINRLEQALQDAKQCIKLKPDWPKGYMRLASCYHKLSKFPDAIAAYEQVLRIDPGNTEARQSLHKLRHQQQHPQSSSSSSSSSSSNSSNSHHHANNNNNNNFLQNIQQYFQRIDWQAQWRSLQLRAQRLYAQCLTWWVSLSPETQKYIQIGAILCLVYYFFIHRVLFPTYASSYEYPHSSSAPGSSSSPYARDDPYQHSYHRYHNSYSYSDYSYGHGGMSWLTWGIIMYAAYALPPMFPEQLGPMYARPFFGMNWTTFMWLLNMFSRNGGMQMPFFGGGGFGRPMFGGRRRYY